MTKIQTGNSFWELVWWFVGVPAASAFMALGVWVSLYSVSALMEAGLKNMPQLYTTGVFFFIFLLFSPSVFMFLATRFMRQWTYGKTAASSVLMAAAPFFLPEPYPVSLTFGMQEFLYVGATSLVLSSIGYWAAVIHKEWNGGTRDH